MTNDEFRRSRLEQPPYLVAGIHPGMTADALKQQADQAFIDKMR